MYEYEYINQKTGEREIFYKHSWEKVPEKFNSPEWYCNYEIYID